MWILRPKHSQIQVFSTSQCIRMISWLCELFQDWKKMYYWNQKKKKLRLAYTKKRKSNTIHIRILICTQSGHHPNSFSKFHADRPILSAMGHGTKILWSENVLFHWNELKAAHRALCRIFHIFGQLPAPLPLRCRQITIHHWRNIQPSAALFPHP